MNSYEDLLRRILRDRQLVDLRLVSTQDNFPQDGNGQKGFLCLVSSRSELMDKGNFPVRSCPEERFLKWKPAFTMFSYDAYNAHFSRFLPQL